MRITLNYGDSILIADHNLPFTSTVAVSTFDHIESQGLQPVRADQQSTNHFGAGVLISRLSPKFRNLTVTVICDGKLTPWAYQFFYQTNHRFWLEEQIA